MSTTPIYTQTSYLNTSSGNITLKMPGTMGSAVLINSGGGGSGGSGAFTTSYNSWASTGTADIKPNSINVNGDAVFNGNNEWQGREMREWFNSVESRLNILQPNPKLEKDWEELADLRMKYVELERQLLEKQRVFDILKKN
jgi:hypothetical protein